MGQGRDNLGTTPGTGRRDAVPGAVPGAVSARASRTAQAFQGRVTLDDFRGAMRAAGIAPPDVVADGRLHRFHVEDDARGSRNGWYVLFTDDPPAGAFGCWKRGIKQTWCARAMHTLTETERASVRARMDATERQQRERDRRISERAAKRARATWATAKPADPAHPYLTRKRVGPHGIRQSGDRLVIPVTRGDVLEGLQFIEPDGTKRFLLGTPKRGRYFMIGALNGRVAIAEGYATAATIHEATGLATVVAFDAGNLRPVAEAIRESLPDLDLIVAADDDRETAGNPGRTNATAAAKAVGGRIAFPDFAPGEPGTDFNDLARLHGREAVARAFSPGRGSSPDRALKVFTRWMELPDPTPVLAALGAVAANQLDGDPVWLGIVAPPSSAKTEILNALSQLPNVHAAATITPAALLSGTPKREKAADAKGGLLRQIGDFGILVLKDFGSVLSMRPDAKAEVLAALREIYDGEWTRHLGTDGGKTLAWKGKLGLVFGCTPVLDSHHAVMGAMGERFVLCRMDAAGAPQAKKALEHRGNQTPVMRHELASAVADLFAGRNDEPRGLDPSEADELVSLASLAVRLRSTVERDRHSREIESIHGAEGPARLALTLERLLAGLDVLGTDRAVAWSVVRRVAMDSVPPLRRRALEYLRGASGLVDTSVVAEVLGLPTLTTRRTLEDLAAYQLVRRTKQGSGKADLWASLEPTP